MSRRKYEFEYEKKNDIVRQIEHISGIQENLPESFRMLLFATTGKKICDLICDNELGQVLNDYLEKKIEKLKKRLSESDGDLEVQDDKIPWAQDFDVLPDKDFGNIKEFKCPHCGKEYKGVPVFSLYSPYICECGEKFKILFSPRV